MSRSDQQEGGDPGQTEAMEVPEATVLLGAKLNTRDRKMALVHGNIEALGTLTRVVLVTCVHSPGGVDCGHSGRWGGGDSEDKSACCQVCWKGARTAGAAAGG